MGFHPHPYARIRLHQHDVAALTDWRRRLQGHATSEGLLKAIRIVLKSLTKRTTLDLKLNADAAELDASELRVRWTSSNGFIAVPRRTPAVDRSHDIGNDGLVVPEIGWKRCR